jgi:hypothetical protein
MGSLTITESGTRWLKRSALAAGVVAALTLVVLGRIPPGVAPLGLDAAVTTGPTGELAVAPIGRVAAASALRPGKGRLDGSVTVQNQTAAALAVKVRVRPSIGDADSALRVRVSGPGGVLYDGPAGGLRRFTRRAFTIGANGTAIVSVSAWVPRGVSGGWLGRSVMLPLEWRPMQDGKVRR